MQMPNGEAIERNRNHINYTPPFATQFSLQRRKQFLILYADTTLQKRNVTKLKEQQTHKTQRSVLAHFISCCPIPMGSVNAEELKWTEGKKLLVGVWMMCRTRIPPIPRDSKWQSLTRHNVSFAVPLHTQCTLQLNEICFYIFSINSVAPSCRTHTTG